MNEALTELTDSVEQSARAVELAAEGQAERGFAAGSSSERCVCHMCVCVWVYLCVCVCVEGRGFTAEGRAERGFAASSSVCVCVCHICVCVTPTHPHDA